MNKHDKLNRLAKAANHLRSAADSLRQVAKAPDNNHYLCLEAAHYLNRVNEIISCDHGEAGLDALIASVVKDLKQ